MATAAPWFDRLASLAVLLGKRRRDIEAFRAQVEPLRDTGLEPVQGELALLAELDGTLTQAFGLLQKMPHDAPEGTLDEIEDLVEHPAWSAASAVLAELEAKNRHQADVLQQVRLDLNEWEGQVNELAKVIDGARFDGAPFSALEAQLRGARSSLATIRSALADRLYGGLPELRSSAQAAMATLRTGVDGAAKQVDRVKQLVKQADLLIMQVGISEQEYEYRVLLRSADRFQTRGINIIQDVRRVTKQDRDWMIAMLEQLTTNLNADLRAAHRRAHAQLPGGEPAPQGLPRTISPAEPVAAGEALDTTQTLGILGEFMFRLIIPDQMQEYLKREKWSFSITTNDLELPWELISFESAEDEGQGNLRYLCLERSVSRMPLGGIFPPTASRQKPARDRKRRMLLIHSDPEGNLPAAGTEVDTIVQELGADLDVERVDPASATNANINRILMGRSFDFLHYAGHAVFDSSNPPHSGLQLKDSLLTADKIRRLSKGGSLVFLNACESGTVARESDAQRVSYLLRNPEPVVGLASAFVYSGALGCVGSLWPVYDRPAADLAVRFYRYVLEGEPTGEALRRARLDVRLRYPREITWAAYVLYGDPTFRLTET